MCVTGARTGHVEIVRDAARLRELAPQWDALAQAALEPNVFYESWMLLPALEAFGEDVAVLLVWLQDPLQPSAPGTLGALVPLQRTPRFKHTPFAAWKAWKHAHCYLCTPLVRADAVDACLDAAIRALRGNGGPQLFELGNIAGDGPFREALDRAAQRHRLPALLSDHHERALLRLGPGEAASLDTAGSTQFRKGMRRRERRLRELGLERHDSVAGGAALERWIGEFLALERSGWKGEAGSALACNAAHERYFRRIVTEAHRRGRLLLAGLDLAGRPIARRCTFVAGDGAFAFKTAYDEEFARYSPGVLLESDAIAHARARPGLRWVDSCTAPDNELLNRLWNGRRVVESVALAAGALEKLLIASFPMLRRMRRLLPEPSQ